jgi:hypothetical protein
VPLHARSGAHVLARDVVVRGEGDDERRILGLFRLEVTCMQVNQVDAQLFALCQRAEAEETPTRVST